MQGISVKINNFFLKYFHLNLFWAVDTSWSSNTPSNQHAKFSILHETKTVSLKVNFIAFSKPQIFKIIIILLFN